MSGLIALRDAAIAGIKAQMPELKTVEKVRGPLSEEGLKRLSLRTPAVAVGVIGTRPLIMLDTAQYRVPVMLAAFLLTEGQNRLDRGHELVERLVLTIAGSTWGLPHTRLPSEVESEPIYDDRTREKDDRTRHLSESGLFLQGVSWVQEIRIARVLPATGAGRADDRADADALGQRTDPSVWPEEITTVIDHPKGIR